MNLKSLSYRLVSPLLPLGLAAGLAGATPASAQAINVTAPFSFCVNSQVFAKGHYQFELVSPWLLSIRDLNSTGQKLFAVRPERNETHDSFRGLTFHTAQGMRELETISASSADATFVVLGKAPTHPLPGCGGSEPGSERFGQRVAASDPGHITIRTNENSRGSRNVSQ